MQRAYQASAADLAAMLKPTNVNGRWRKPVLSKRKAAVLRKHALENNIFGSWTPGQGGWLQEWDGQAKHTIPNPPRLHHNVRNIDTRISKIQLAMEQMPKKIKEMQEARKASKRLTGLDKWLASKD